MKKAFVLLGAMMLVSSFASAASIINFCSVTTNFNWNSVADGTTQSNTVTCNGIGSLPAGDTLTSVEVYYQADYSGGTGTGTNQQVTLDTFENPSGSWTTPNQLPPYECITTGVGNSNPGPCTNSGGAIPQQEFSTEVTPSTSGFTVAVTATLVAGAIQSSTFQTIVEFDYTQPAPEPASLLMVGGGAGLLGLAQVVGKFMKKKKS